MIDHQMRKVGCTHGVSFSPPRPLFTHPLTLPSNPICCFSARPFSPSLENNNKTLLSPCCCRAPYLKSFAFVCLLKSAFMHHSQYVEIQSWVKAATFSKWTLQKTTWFWVTLISHSKYQPFRMNVGHVTVINLFFFFYHFQLFIISYSISYNIFRLITLFLDAIIRGIITQQSLASLLPVFA